MTPWTPYYLRADDEAAMMDALDAAGWRTTDPETDEPVTVTGSDVHRVKLLPTLSERTGEMLDDGEGGEYPEYEQIEGYHSNVIMRPDTPLPEALESVLIDPCPETPLVEFSGCAEEKE